MVGGVFAPGKKRFIYSPLLKVAGQMISGKGENLPYKEGA